MKIKEVIATLEVFAPLPLQDGFDNAGLQVGVTEAEISGALLCLDVTEDVLREAVSKGCNLVVAHHPLLFHPLRQLTDATLVERCVRYAVENGLTIYAAHTNLDNARGGVNYEIAARLGLHDIVPLRRNDAGNGGSGIIATLPTPISSGEFINLIKQTFGVECAMCNALIERPISRVALCGGAGDFLLDDAVEQQADAFLTGEMHYHQYFGHEGQIQIVVIGHYQSEQFTPAVLQRIIVEKHPNLSTYITTVNTNPILYL
ncbi:MAG: Nif3-like dinuclear metal center hexameric protein [Bacteroidaceae bacterium]|nr:Nif3-like dinuclear metal center hexameric protein [Bacteroidaceae bacterium]MBR4782679.1 Nif3-like dinuclear metal center hexameric protein [Bacteroidaceae bacterium]